MTEVEWLNCNDPKPMLEFLRGETGQRQLRLFAVACCRRAWHLLDEQSRKAVQVAERFAGGAADEAELRSTNICMEFDPATLEAAAYLVSVLRYDRPSTLLRYGIVDITRLDEAAGRRLESICLSGSRFPAEVALAVARSVAAVGPPTEASTQATLLRDLFGNPFRPSPTIDATWLSWQDRTVPKLLASICEERSLPEGTLDPVRLAILADALEECGCTDAELLRHLRSEGPHVRGCWVVDLLTGTG